MAADQKEYKIISPDGTPLAVQRSGNGSPLLLVHGVNADHTRWDIVVPTLSENFTVYTFDRRGHGDSGDGEEYSIEREYEDITSTAASIKAPVDILGHSFGASCLLGAAPRIHNLRRLILYEPPSFREKDLLDRDEHVKQMNLSLAKGDREAVVLNMMNETAAMPLSVLEMLRATPGWSRQVKSAHTIPRELSSSNAFTRNLDALNKITTKTMLLLGGESPERFVWAIDRLHTLLTDSSIVILPGQKHSAMMTAPNLLIKEITRFLLE